MTTYGINKMKCSACGETLMQVTGVDREDDREPRAGDFTVCSRCANVMVWTGDGLREPTQDELLTALHDELLTETVMAVRDFHTKPMFYGVKKFLEVGDARGKKPRWIGCIVLADFRKHRLGVIDINSKETQVEIDDWLHEQLALARRGQHEAQAEIDEMLKQARDEAGS